jgi:hypothetical protein
LPIVLGFSIGRLLIGEGASSGGDHGGLTIGGRGQGLGRAPLWCGQPLTPIQLSFVLRSSSGKNKTSGTCFVQFREYFCVAYLKHKTAENRELTLWHLVSRLVPKIA